MSLRRRVEVSHPGFICFVSRELCPTCCLLTKFRLGVELASVDSPEDRSLIKSGTGQKQPKEMYSNAKAQKGQEYLVPKHQICSGDEEEQVV